MVKGFLKLFGYQHKSELPRKLPLALAEEIDRQVGDKFWYTGKGAGRSYEVYAELLSMALGSLRYLSTTNGLTPVGVRYHATRVAMYMMYLADIYGELYKSERHTQ